MTSAAQTLEAQGSKTMAALSAGPMRVYSGCVVSRTHAGIFWLRGQQDLCGYILAAWSAGPVWVYSGCAVSRTSAGILWLCDQQDPCRYTLAALSAEYTQVCSP